MEAQTHQQSKSNGEVNKYDDSDMRMLSTAIRDKITNLLCV